MRMNANGSRVRNRKRFSFHLLFAMFLLSPKIHHLFNGLFGLFWPHSSGVHAYIHTQHTAQPNAFIIPYYQRTKFSVHFALFFIAVFDSECNCHGGWTLIWFRWTFIVFVYFFFIPLAQSKPIRNILIHSSFLYSLVTRNCRLIFSFDWVGSIGLWFGFWFVF